MFLLLSKQDQVRADLQYVCRKLMKRALHHTAETSSIHWASVCLKSSVRPLPISAKFSICWNCSKQDFYLCLENCCLNIITRILFIVIIIIEAYSCLPKSSLHGCIALFGVEKQEWKQNANLNSRSAQTLNFHFSLVNCEIIITAEGSREIQVIETIGLFPFSKLLTLGNQLWEFYQNMVVLKGDGHFAVFDTCKQSW